MKKILVWAIALLFSSSFSMAFAADKKQEKTPQMGLVGPVDPAMPKKSVETEVKEEMKEKKDKKKTKKAKKETKKEDTTKKEDKKEDKKDK